MTTLKDRPMNAQRIAIGLLLFLLCTACLVQTSMSGCAKNPGEADIVADTGESDDSEFFNRRDEATEPEEAAWEPVSDSVFNQVQMMYEDSSVNIMSMENATNIEATMKCMIEYREDVSYEKQFLDGFCVFSNTFPNQDSYTVEISDGQTYETNWATLERLGDAGYTLDSDDNDAGMFWRMIVGGDELPENDASGGVSVQVGS